MVSSRTKSTSYFQILENMDKYFPLLPMSQITFPHSTIMNIPNRHQVSERKLQNGVPICKCTIWSCWECCKHQATGNSQKQAPSKWHFPGNALHNINLLYGKTFSCFVHFMATCLANFQKPPEL